MKVINHTPNAPSLEERSDPMLIVAFTLRGEEDIPLAENKYPGEPRRVALVKLFIELLQDSGYDIGELSGSFQVLAVPDKPLNFPEELHINPLLPKIK